MPDLLSVLVTIALFILFPIFIFYLLVRAIRTPGTRWWGIVILLTLLICYCTTFTAILGLIAGGVDTGAAALEQNYCGQFVEALKQTETLPDALARMDAAAASDDYRLKAPEATYRFRYVWLLGGCFLFAGANLMMFGKNRKRRHAADCIVMILAALFAFLTGIWQIAWANGYAVQANTSRHMLTEWHRNIPLDSIRAPNAEIAAKLAERSIRNLHILKNFFLELADGKNAPGTPDGNGKAVADGPGVAIIGGADGPAKIVVGPGPGTEQADAAQEATPAETAIPSVPMPAAEEQPAGAN